MTSAEYGNSAMVQPDGCQHAEAFRKIAVTLPCGLTEFSCQADTRINHFEASARNIVLGSNLLLQGQTDTLPPEAILYDFEQPRPLGKWYTPAQADMFGRFQI